jgi:hypothetical protein
VLPDLLDPVVDLAEQGLVSRNALVAGVQGPDCSPRVLR